MVGVYWLSVILQLNLSNICITGFFASSVFLYPNQQTDFLKNLFCIYLQIILLLPEIKIPFQSLTEWWYFFGFRSSEIFQWTK